MLNLALCRMHASRSYLACALLAKVAHAGAIPAHKAKTMRSADAELLTFGNAGMKWQHRLSEADTH